uniref:Uncharacterized protein n=1 Tax=Parascaris equorum TaxID=6256 RepID=A0A914RUS6_PAREQ
LLLNRVNSGRKIGNVKTHSSVARSSQGDYRLLPVKRKHLSRLSLKLCLVECIVRHRLHNRSVCKTV